MREHVRSERGSSEVQPGRQDSTEIRLFVDSVICICHPHHGMRACEAKERKKDTQRVGGEAAVTELLT